jgi:FkbM family methyltransferase
MVEWVRGVSGGENYMTNLRSFQDNLVACQSQLAGPLPAIFAKYFPDGEGGIRTTGTFVECGAFDGFMWSNTWPLTLMNWTGLLFEPQADRYKTCEERYKENDKIIVDNVAVGAYNGAIKLYEGGSMTTTYEPILPVWEKIGWVKQLMHFDTPTEVPIFTLDYLLNEWDWVPYKFDLLVIDVEGGEAEVLRGLSLDVWKPSMMIVELNRESREEPIASDTLFILDHLKQSGYEIIHTDAINTIFWKDQ